jgi:hypothetical protein
MTRPLSILSAWQVQVKEVKWPEGPAMVALDAYFFEKSEAV